MNGVDWIARRILAATDQADRDAMRAGAPRFNPRPAGVIRPGSATDKVLQHMEAHKGRHFQRHQIVLATGCTEQAVDWALSFLRAQGLIAAFGDPLRNPRYLRYSVLVATKGEGDNHA